MSGGLGVESIDYSMGPNVLSHLTNNSTPPETCFHENPDHALHSIVWAVSLVHVFLSHMFL